MNTLPDLNLKQYFKQVDYSSWQRSNRKKDASGQKTKTVPWGLPPSLPKVVTPSLGSNPARRENSSAGSSSASKQVQLDWPGLSRPSTIHVGSAVSLKDMYAMKKNAVAQEPLPEKKDTVKILKMLIKLKRTAIEELEAHCASLEDRNQQLTREIEDGNKSSFSSVRESLILHGKLGNSLAALNGWSRGQIGRAQAELRDVQDSAQKRLHGLQEQLGNVSAEVLKARGELHTLRTYRDMQYPVKALRIAKMKTKIHNLKETLQDEHKGVALICKNEMERLTGKSKEKEDDMLAAIAKQHLSYISPVARQMASRNCLMKKEIEMFKKTIKELEETNEELAADVHELQHSRKDLRKEMLHNVFLRVDKCAPDMDVVLDIPHEQGWGTAQQNSAYIALMTLNTQRGNKETLRRRASTPIPPSHQPVPRGGDGAAGPRHPPLGQSASYHPGDKAILSRFNWSSDSEDSDSSGADCLYRVVLLGDHGVGKSSLANIFAGIQEKDANEPLGEDTHERTLTVDGEETTLVVMDTWETEKQEEDERWVQDYCMQVGNAYVIVYSITDRSSFNSASELRIQLRRIRQAENIPIILVGNKSDLVRCREVAVEEGRACAVVFDCKFIETSASLHHNVTELFEGIVRQIRLRRDSKETNERRRSVYKRKESVTKKARRFLDRLVAKNNKKMALKVRSKSCHDLSVL
ncbi:hypothetical protein SKAU_G00151740 [Synaphobranchus kaupii]|uniref:Small monomeric GTPase n=1 Tax=Synaphobranchus kaupii TaxID=118154 RepID=A0A9Q1IWR2_SYNKA|nr:hypothetical protein SKAU_G00151740 [Synaphobranchus kaupii]